MKKMLLFTLFTSCFETGHCREVKIRNLVFEGAGIRGLAYAGVLGELEKQGLVQDVEKVGGLCGILGNFPVTLFDSVATDPLQQAYRIVNRQTLGI